MSMNTSQASGAVATAPGTYDIGGVDAYRYKQQLASGDFAEFRGFLADAKWRKDWDDSAFILYLVAHRISIPALDAAVAAEPNAPDLALIRGAYLAKMVREARGSSQVEQTADAKFQDAASLAQHAVPALQRAAALDPTDPIPHFLVIDPFMIFSETAGVAAAYQDAARLAPSFVALQRLMVNARSEKWGGSHAEALQIARDAQTKGAPGSDMPVCLFLAHFHVWQYERALRRTSPRRTPTCETRRLTRN